MNIPAEPSPARTLEEIYTLFDPTLEVDPLGALYVPRHEIRLQQLAFELKGTERPLHAFVCGHSGSGKSTELRRLVALPEIQDRYLPIVLKAREFGDVVHLTSEALLVEIGDGLVRAAKAMGQGQRRKETDKALGLSKGLEEQLAAWGTEVVREFLKSRSAEAEAGAGASAWIASFRALLSTRREWSYQEKQIIEPKVRDLVAILDRIAQDLANRSSRKLLVVVDDLEKGDSDAHREMHERVFQDGLPVLTQPNFSILYTLPIYFRALPGSRIPHEQIFAFSAARLYAVEKKGDDHPPIDESSPGTKLMRSFVEKRVAEVATLFAPAALAELILIGGGLFRETARAIRDAAFFALLRGTRKRIEVEDARRVFDQVKKEFQPMIRGDAVAILREVLERREGWVAGVEPFLQSRAVVEYENGDLWLDLRTVIKRYVRELKANG